MWYWNLTKTWVIKEGWSKSSAATIIKASKVGPRNSSCHICRRNPENKNKLLAMRALTFLMLSMTTHSLGVPTGPVMSLNRVDNVQGTRKRAKASLRGWLMFFRQSPRHFCWKWHRGRRTIFWSIAQGCRTPLRSWKWHRSRGTIFWSIAHGCRTPLRRWSWTCWTPAWTTLNRLRSF